MSETAPSLASTAPATPAPVLSHGDAARILQADLANLVARTRSGKTLTASQRQLVTSLTAAGAGRGGDGGTERLTAKSRSELAAMLGVHRNSLARWERQPDAPKPAANGERDCTAWREWCNRTGRTIGRPGANEADDKTKLEQRRLELQNAILEIELEAKRGDLIGRGEVERDAAEIAFRLKTSLLAIPDSIAPVLAGRDTVSIATELRRVIGDALRHLSDGKFSSA